MGSKNRILITTGDPDGVGWEVTAKALNALGPKAGVQFIYYRSPQRFRGRAPQLSERFRRHVSVPCLVDARDLPFDPKVVIEVRSQDSAAHWVEEAAEACLHGEFQAMVTAPLSKTLIRDAGMTDIGHTEILKRVTKKHDLFMGFIGAEFSVLLATGHSPLSRALKQLDRRLLRAALLAAGKMRLLLPRPKATRPIALVGLNPHAGEAGLIGSDEIWFQKLIKDLKPQLKIAGPLVPDSAFLPQNWARYSLYVCPYHDQGLIPFKMVHGFDSGVHLTLGLPFVRTSVDHGTAKDIFGKNQARYGSMLDAIKVAIRLCKEKQL